MKPFRSITRQIVSVYVLFTVACCVLFVILGTVVIEAIEAHLVDDRLKEVAAWAAPRYAGGLPVEMPSGLSFHHGEGIPQSLRTLRAGVQEIEVDGIGLHVLGGSTAAGPFVVVDHESDYDKVEQAVFALVGLCVAGFIGFSLILGNFMARRFVSPIIDLSAAVAERKRELPLLDTNNELGALARSFDGYAKEMRDVLDRERFFTGDVSHELRTPLTIIRGAADILLLECANNVALTGPVDRIQRAVQDASDSVSVLLMLARAPQLIESHDISAGALARRQVEQYQFLVKQKDVELTFEGGDFRFRVQEKLLEAALGNLIRNACLYTDAGKVVVRIIDRRIQVQDCGGGLPPAVLAMFRGEQLDRLAGSEGTGLGLVLVQRICHHIGATVQVVATSASGTIIEMDCSPSFTKT